MSIQQELKNMLGMIRGSDRPTTIPVQYPDGSEWAGKKAGVLVMKEEHGQRKYELVTPTPKAQVARTEFKLEHSFDDLASLQGFLQSNHVPWNEPTIAAFVRERSVVVADMENPEGGVVTLHFQEHTELTAWGEIETQDLSHSEFADLLLDNRRMVTTKGVVDLVASLRAAKSVTYEADFATGQQPAVSTTFTFKGGKAEHSKSQVPTSFSASIRFTAGPWDPGLEPAQLADFSVRILPPLEGSVEPRFRLKWVNLQECRTRDFVEIKDRVTEVLPCAVYGGVPNSIRFVTPE